MSFAQALKDRHDYWFKKPPVVIPAAGNRGSSSGSGSGVVATPTILEVIHDKKLCQRRMSPEDGEHSYRCCPFWQRKLANKWNARCWALFRGIPVPELLWRGETIEEIPWDKLGPHYVLKPTNSWSCKGVYPMSRGRNLFTGRKIDVRRLCQRLQTIRDKNLQTSFLIEKMVTNEEGRYQVPIDYKCHLFGGFLDSILVIQRTGPHSGTAMVVDEHWQIKSPDQYLHIPPYPFPEQPFQAPRCLAALVAAAKCLGHSYGGFVRVDMYATANGPVFGEFTPFPNAGNGYQPYADRQLSRWQRAEGDSFAPWVGLGMGLAMVIETGTRVGIGAGATGLSMAGAGVCSGVSGGELASILNKREKKRKRKNKKNRKKGKREMHEF